METEKARLKGVFLIIRINASIDKNNGKYSFPLALPIIPKLVTLIFEGKLKTFKTFA